jgi:NDT80 / PhoG like DNA-binding  family
MDGYDTMTMGYLPNPLPANGLQNLDYMSATSGLDLQDQYSNFDSETFMRLEHLVQSDDRSLVLTLHSGDELNFAPSNGFSHPALLKRYSTGYSTGFDDPYADPAMAQFDHMPPDHAVPESPSLERENKLLGFSMPLYSFTLLDFSLRRTSLNMTAQLHGMFFLAESQWPTPPDAPPPPPELTCYRRNLFQITGSVTLPRSLRYIMTEQGDRIPILAQELAISATESVEGNPVKIISVPWKTPAGGGATTAEDKVEKEPPSLSLDTMAGQDLDTDYATFPIQWKRLQFRIATANNGRRKELQQHFVIRLKVMATLSTGAKISIAEAHSGAIIVRGRSPRNFQSRKDFPLGNSSGSSRKHMPSGMTRNSNGDSAAQITSAPKVKSSPDEVPQMVLQYENNELHITNPPTPDLADWHQFAQQSMIQEPLPTSAYSASMIPPPITPYTQQPSPDLAQNIPRTHPNMVAMNAPVNLSFTISPSNFKPFTPIRKQNSRRDSCQYPITGPIFRSSATASKIQFFATLVFNVTDNIGGAEEHTFSNGPPSQPHTTKV